MRPIRRFGERFFAAARLGVQQGSPQQAELIPEGKAVRHRYRAVPEIPGRTLYDGTRVKHRKAFTITVAELVDEAHAPPPLFRRGGMRELFLLMLLLPVFLGFGAFRGLSGSSTSIVLSNLPFIDLTNPTYNVNNAGVDTYTTLQAVFTTNGAATYYGGYASIYTSSKPLLYAPGTWVVGAGTNRRQTTSGTTFKIASGAVAADWAGQGYFTSKGFASNTSIGTQLGEVCGFRDFLIDGNAQTYGNGILTAGIAQPFFVNLRWENYKGNQAMPTRGTTVAKNSGQGFMICMTIYTINGGDATTAQNPNDPTIMNIRNTAITGGTNACPLIWTDDGKLADTVTNSSITDGIVYVVQPEGAPANTVADGTKSPAIGTQGVIDINHAGAWHFDFVHLNGSGGNGMVLKNCFMTHITNSWLDGWGTEHQTGNTYDCINATTTDGGSGASVPSGLIIWGNSFRWRDEQTNGGGTVVYNWLNVTASGKNLSLIVTNNFGFVQSSSANGTLFLFTFARGGAPGAITATINNNNVFSDTNATIEDTRVFDSTVPASWLTITGSNNNWNFGTAAPTSGNWPAGYIREDSTPAFNTPIRYHCSVGGAPGTWLEATLIQMRRGAYSGQPGAVTSFTIAHGLGTTPTSWWVTPQDTDAQTSPDMSVTADGTNLTLNFTAALTAATTYQWVWGVVA